MLRFADVAGLWLLASGRIAGLGRSVRLGGVLVFIVFLDVFWLLWLPLASRASRLFWESLFLPPVFVPYFISCSVLLLLLLLVLRGRALAGWGSM